MSNVLYLAIGNVLYLDMSNVLYLDMRKILYLDMSNAWTRHSSSPIIRYYLGKTIYFRI